MPASRDVAVPTLHTWCMFFGVVSGGHLAGGGIEFDFESGTTFKVDADGALHIRGDDRDYLLVPTGRTIPTMPPLAPPELWAWWCASACCWLVGVLILVAWSVALDGGRPFGGQVVTLIAVAAATIALGAASIKIWLRARTARPERNRAVAAVRGVTGLHLTRRQTQRFLAATKDYIVAGDGTAWAVHDGSIFRGNRTG